MQPVKPNLVALELDQATAIFRSSGDNGQFLIVMPTEHALTPDVKAVRLAPIGNQLPQHDATTAQASGRRYFHIVTLIHGWLLAIGRSSFRHQSRVPAQHNRTPTMLVPGLRTVAAEAP
jgi:hypothetical protein